MNRDDMSNIQYCIRKLIKAGLIEKHGGGDHKRGVTYKASALGIATTDKYAAFRRELLFPLTKSISDSDRRVNQVTEMLTLLAGIYDQAASIAATHRTGEDAAQP